MKKCYLCGNTSFIKRPGKVRDNENLDILECNACGLVCLSSFDHISNNFYENSSMHETEIDINSWVRECEPDDARRIKYLKQLLTNKSVLDFGSGPGGFLIKAKTTASSVAGIEVEKRLKEHYQKNGIDLYSSIDEVNTQYDIITLFHVLEHLSDPISTLISLSKKLNNKGKIIIEVPSSNDALLLLYQSEQFSRFTYWSPHLFLFNRKTLATVAEKSRLKVISTKNIQRYPLSNHLYWLAYGLPGGHKEWSFLDSEDLHIAYEKQLASNDLTDTILGIFSVE